VGGIIDTDEKVAYNLVTNNCSQFKKGAKTMDILFMTKMARIEGLHFSIKGVPHSP